MRISKTLLEIGRKAKSASLALRLATLTEKNQLLDQIAESLDTHRKEILEANLKDLERAKENHLSEAFIDRLSLQGNRLDNIISDVKHVISLPDPVNQTLEEKTLENGLFLQRKSTPLGVIAVIYEARPNVTVDVASLALKTSNVCILRGGKETFQTNCKLVEAIQQGVVKAGFPKEVVQFIPKTGRSFVKQLLKMDAYIDMVIPRGGATLHRFCLDHSTIPVITGGIGICHLFVDESANIEESIEVIFNAKTQRPSVCNALDTLLIHKNIASKLLPSLVNKLKSENVSFRLDPVSWSILHPEREDPHFSLAKEGDWKTEWLSLILGIKVVGTFEEAISHIQTYSSGHSDGILTNDEKNADTFINAIDSAAVYVNASTRFTDGGQFGLGAEVAVSTQKLHARGPMGLEALTSYKWIVKGSYHIRKS